MLEINEFCYISRVFVLHYHTFINDLKYLNEYGFVYEILSIFTCINLFPVKRDGFEKLRNMDE